MTHVCLLTTILIPSRGDLSMPPDNNSADFSVCFLACLLNLILLISGCGLGLPSDQNFAFCTTCCLPSYLLTAACLRPCFQPVMISSDPARCCPVCFSMVFSLVALLHGDLPISLHVHLTVESTTRSELQCTGLLSLCALSSPVLHSRGVWPRELREALLSSRPLA